MTKRSRGPDRPSRGSADLRRLRRMTDEEIIRTAPADLPVLPDEFWASAELQLPVPKKAISLRVDEDVLEWFRAGGPRYQSRMNAVLRSFMTHARRRPVRSKRSRRPAG